MNRAIDLSAAGIVAGSGVAVCPRRCLPPDSRDAIWGDAVLLVYSLGVSGYVADSVG